MHDKSTRGEGTESETRPGVTSGLDGRGDLRRSSPPLDCICYLAFVIVRIS